MAELKASTGQMDMAKAGGIVKGCWGEKRRYGVSANHASGMI